MTHSDKETRCCSRCSRGAYPCGDTICECHGYETPASTEVGYPRNFTPEKIKKELEESGVLPKEVDESWEKRFFEFADAFTSNPATYMWANKEVVGDFIRQTLQAQRKADIEELDEELWALHERCISEECCMRKTDALLHQKLQG